jgi:hypothetical protein
MACCAFAIYLLGRFLSGLDWVSERVPFLRQAAPAPMLNAASNWRPDFTSASFPQSLTSAAQPARRPVVGRLGAWLAVAAGLELTLLVGGTLGWSLVALVPDAPPALLSAADTALSFCRSLRAIGPSF